MTLSYLVATLGQVFTVAIIVRAVLSWFPTRGALEPVVAFVNSATDPILRPIQQRMPAMGAIDLSPLIAILLIGVTESLLLSLLAGR